MNTYESKFCLSANKMHSLGKPASSISSPEVDDHICTIFQYIICFCKIKKLHMHIITEPLCMLYVCLINLRIRWYHGLITREKAVELLSGGNTGLYLVRESTHYRGDFTLCVVGPDGNVEHYRVLNKQNKLTVDEDDFFDNLTQLVKVGRRR